MLNHTLKMDLENDRHLIVGDMHGRYDHFLKLLEIANYDPAKDVIYSVGDLIDRGPKSVECVEFFQQERCYAIKGNHEMMMLDPAWSETWLDNGGMQCLTSIMDRGIDQDAFRDILRKFPWVIDVGEDDEEHAFRIVHAEMPPGWPEEYWQRMLDGALNHDDPSFARIIWSRRLIQAAAANANNLLPVAHGIQFHGNRYRNVFTGHTPCQKVFKCGDHWFLDTWFGGTLSMIDAVTKEVFTVDITQPVE